MLSARSLAVVASLALSAGLALEAQAQQAAGDSSTGAFDVDFDGGAIVSLRRVRDSFDTEYVREGARLGDVSLTYRTPDGEWRSVSTEDLTEDVETETLDGGGCEATYHVNTDDGPALELTVRFEVEPDRIDWRVTARNASGEPVEIGDLALPLPMNSNFQRGPSSAVLKHSFVSGHGSFLFWMRANSVGPYLMMTPQGDTHLEYWDVARSGRRRGRGAYRVYVHSAATGADAAERGTDWRQPHTSASLAASGEEGDAHTYAFTLQWADDYDDVRQTLVDEGLVDVHVAPGMTVPSDLSAQIALRSSQAIQSVEAEFPDETQIEPAGEGGGYQRYRVRFGRLGENRLKVVYGDGRHVFLEFFSTEPLETLIKKRGAFVAQSQHRDPSKWYDGLITDWNMDNHVLPSPDNYDRISGFRIYAVTCDDPGLCKPAYLAAKNAEYPVQEEVAALDYYIKNFVWGGLQMTTDEPHPYGVYGIQDWKRNRDSDDPGRDGRLHIWRVYDYPHVVLMYYGMHRVAKNYPHIETELSAEEYLERAYGTAEAMFTVPREVANWSAYSTGFYNELVLLDLMDSLRAAGKDEQADTLRAHWERKVRRFVRGRTDLFRSEYAFDSTGFESTHALARYAVRRARQAEGEDLGYSLEDAQDFMKVQMAANLFCRGVIEPAYYYLGSDYRGGAGNAYTLSYMSQMGGWSVLDYALHVADDPAPYLRLGYASYLSSWALMNSGTPESGYGYWYPGPENDGAAGGGFEPAPYGRTWLGQPHTRGSWYYACEIDLGYCGALRSAATVLADDPIFGRCCFGGEWRSEQDALAVVPKDGLRRRFHALLNGAKLHVTLQTDRFVADQPIRVTEDLRELQFSLESDNPDAHAATLELAGLPSATCEVRVDGRVVAEAAGQEGEPLRLNLPVPAGGRLDGITVRLAP